MTRRAIHIDKIVVRGGAVTQRHAERLRELITADLRRRLAAPPPTGPVEPLPAHADPERMVGPVASHVIAQLPKEAWR